MHFRKSMNMGSVSRAIFCLVSIVITLLCFSTPALANTNTDYSSITVGDSIQLGRYGNKEITWICIAVDNNGPLMLSEENLCTKAFDAAGDNSSYHSDGWGYIRNSRGSNCWEDSSLRQWLNSTGKVDWTHCPPVSSAVSNGVNPYAEEEGFLTGFTSEELAHVKYATHTVYLNTYETRRDGYCDGGTKTRSYYGDIESLPDDTSWFWQRKLDDKFFLLNYDQVRDAYHESDTIQQVLLSQDVPWWTGDAVDQANGSFENEHVVDAKRIRDSSQNYGWCPAFEAAGVRPAFYLDAEGIEDPGESDLPIVSSDYSPQQHGWGFLNSNLTKGIGGSYSSTVFNRVTPLWNPIAWTIYAIHKDDLQTGLCHGMCLASVLAFKNEPEWSTWSSTDSVIPPIPSKVTKWDSMRNDDVLAGWSLGEWIMGLQATQITYIWSKSASFQEIKGQKNVLDTTIDGLSNNEPVIIALEGKLSSTDKNNSRHSVVAYKIEGPSQEGFYKIYVYDPNYGPDGINHYITICENSWSYPFSGSVWGSDSGGLISCYGSEAIDAAASLAISDIEQSMYNSYIAVRANKFSITTKNGSVVHSDNEHDNETIETELVPIKYSSGESTGSVRDYYVEGEDTSLTIDCEGDGEETSVDYATQESSVKLSADGGAVYSIAKSDGAYGLEISPDEVSAVGMDYKLANGETISLSGQVEESLVVTISDSQASALEMKGFVGDVAVNSISDEGTVSTNTIHIDDASAVYEVYGGQDGIDARVSLSNAVIMIDKELHTYTGKSITPRVIVKLGDRTLKEETDYKLSYTNNVHAGTADVTVKGIGAYTGTITTHFVIAQADISPIVELSSNTYVYNGKIKTPAVTVKTGSTVLSCNDYNITYSRGRKSVGTYKVTVSLKGNYRGMKTVTFRILPKRTKINKVTASKRGFKVAWKKQAKQITGYQIQYSTSAKFKSGNKTVSIARKTARSTNIGKLKKNKRYYVRIRTYKKVGSKTYYSAWSAKKSVKTKS